MDGNFSNKIFFSDEVHFKLVGYVNKQNCRNWGILKELKGGHYIQKTSLFGALFGPKVGLAEIPPNMCQNVVENYLKRINAGNTLYNFNNRNAHFSDSE